MEIRALLQPWRRHAPQATMAASARRRGRAGDELQARREEIARMEERALREAESLGVQRADLERRLQALEDRERNLEQQSEELKRAKRVQRRELERISGLTAAQAKQMLVADVEQEARHQAALRLQEIEQRDAGTRPSGGRATSSRSRCSGWPRRTRATRRPAWSSCPATR